LVTITINKKVTKKTNNKLGTKFGTTKITKKGIKDIKIKCSKHKFNKKWCLCQISEIIIDTEFLVQINKKKIEKSKRSCFNTKTLKVVSCDKKNGKLVPKKPHHKKLDVKSVEIHELQHVEDIMEHLTKALKKRLDGIDKMQSVGCPCTKTKTQCKKALTNRVQNRIKAILKIAYKRILNHQSHTEKTARKAQAKYLLEQCRKKKLKLKKRAPKKRVQKKREIKRKRK
jgi:hypothetical protein